jgi:predicted transcriptional regulator
VIKEDIENAQHLFIEILKNTILGLDPDTLKVYKVLDGSGLTVAEVARRLKWGQRKAKYRLEKLLDHGLAVKDKKRKSNANIYQPITDALTKLTSLESKELNLTQEELLEWISKKCHTDINRVYITASERKSRSVDDLLSILNFSKWDLIEILSNILSLFPNHVTPPDVENRNQKPSFTTDVPFGSWAAPIERKSESKDAKETPDKRDRRFEEESRIYDDERITAAKTSPLPEEELESIRKVVVEEEQKERLVGKDQKFKEIVETEFRRFKGERVKDYTDHILDVLLEDEEFREDDPERLRVEIIKHTSTIKSESKFQEKGKCIDCGAKVSDSDKYCWRCRLIKLKKFHPEIADLHPFVAGKKTEATCPKCGEKFEDDGKNQKGKWTLLNEHYLSFHGGDE